MVPPKKPLGIQLKQYLREEAEKGRSILPILYVFDLETRLRLPRPAIL
jgi:hypothetical protein